MVFKCKWYGTLPSGSSSVVVGGMVVVSVVLQGSSPPHVVVDVAVVVVVVDGVVVVSGVIYIHLESMFLTFAIWPSQHYHLQIDSFIQILESDIYGITVQCLWKKHHVYIAVHGLHYKGRKGEKALEMCYWFIGLILVLCMYIL